VIRKNFKYEKNYQVEMVANCLGLYIVIDAFAEVMKKNFKLALHRIKIIGTKIIFKKINIAS
jgi:hypothetical protein